jgi:pyruvate dehydrogenase E1 component
VILAKTIKGYGMGSSGEAQNIAHQAKKMDIESLRKFRDRFGIPVSDEDLPKVPYYKPAEDSPEMKYMRERRAALGGYLPARKPVKAPLAIPGCTFSTASWVIRASASSPPPWPSCACWAPC